MSKKKITIAKVAKPRKFDLSFTRKEENTRIILALEGLKNNSGWLFLTQVFQGNIDYLTKQIVSKVGDDGKPLSDAEVDSLRIRHGYLTELLEKPDTFLKSLRAPEATENTDLDPYYTGKS